MRARYTISAIALLGVLLLGSLMGTKSRGGLSAQLVGYTNSPAGGRKIIFVLTNGSSKSARLMSRPLEFWNGTSWMVLGPAIDFSTNAAGVMSHTLGARQSFRFEVNEPTELLPWRLTVLWWVPYDERWAKLEHFVDNSLRRFFNAKPWFARSGILRGPEMPRPNSTTSAP